jgi:transcriptional regulator with XRE-family HTH domain
MYKKSQLDLAKILHCSKGAISHYENGKRKPDFDTLEVLAKYFNVPLTYFFSDVDFTDLSALTPAERRLVERYRELNAEGQARLLDEADLLCSALRYQKDSAPSASSDAG